MEKSYKQNLFKTETKKLLIPPLRALSLFVAVAGLFALVFEVRYFNEFALQIYVARLSAIVIAFFILSVSYSNYGKRHPVFLVHMLLLFIIASFGVIIFLIPGTLVFNSHIISLILFTVALFLSWEVSNQIVVAIYYNIVFASTILLNDKSIYFLPNMFESVLFVLFISVMSIAASAFNYRLRKTAIINSFEVSESEKKFRNIFENSVEGMFHMTTNGKLTTVNSALIKMLGYTSPEEAMELNVYEDLFRNQKDGETFRKLLDRSGKIRNYRISLKKHDGVDIIVRMNAKVNLDENDKPISYEGSIQDITQQVIAEKAKEKALEELKIEKLRAEEASLKAKQESESKSKFLANVSHEIKTPLNSIVGFFTMLENDLFENKEEMKNFAREVKSASDTILDIIGKNLDLTKIESGKMELDELKFNMKEEVNKVLSIVSSEVKQKNLKLSSSFDDNISSVLVGDPIRYRQILLNILSNAVKFTDSGEIIINVELQNKTKTHATILASVKDTGLGIPDDKKDKLFQPYSRLHADKNGKKGTGLGLVISNELVKLMDGEINYESKAGEGSEFSFTARFRLYHTDEVKVTEDDKTQEKVVEKAESEAKEDPKPEPKKAAAPVLPSMEGRKKKRLLLVEDNPISQNVEMKLLKEVGYDVEAVSNGTDAINALQTNPFDLVLMDVEMTDMDGITATKKIRELIGDVSEIPIIAVTAHSSMKDREKCLAAGMDDYIAKPINIHFLKMTIDQWLNDSRR